MCDDYSASEDDFVGHSLHQKSSFGMLYFSKYMTYYWTKSMLERDQSFCEISYYIKYTKFNFGERASDGK